MKVVTEKVIQLFAVFAIGVAAGLYFSGEREHPPGSRAFAQQNDVVAESAPTTFHRRKHFPTETFTIPGRKTCSQMRCESQHWEPACPARETKA